MREKLKRLIKILKSKKGMTLVEMVTGIMVFAVFSICAMMILSPMLNVFANNRSYSEAATIADNIGSRLSTDIQLASALSVSENLLTITSGDGRKSAYGVNNEGYLVNNTALVYPEEYYNNNKLALKFSRNNNIVTVEITVEGKIAYTHTMYAEPIQKLA